MNEPTKLKIKGYSPSVIIESIGNQLSSNTEVANNILEVAKGLDAASEEINDPARQRQYQVWVEALTNAVITISSSTATTSAEVRGLLDTDDESEER